MNTGIRRFFVAHMLAYAIAMPWGIAAVPMIFMWKEAELLAMTDEEAAIRHVVKLTLVPLTVAFVLPHFFSIPWIRSVKRQTHDGRVLFAASSAIIVLSGIGLAAVAWVRFLRGV